MSLFNPSEKFYTEKEQYFAVTGDAVFMRLVLESDGWKVMTATAGEDRTRTKAYEDQGALVRAAEEAFEERGHDATRMTDRFGRPYVEVRGLAARDEADLLTADVARRLEIANVKVLAKRELIELYGDLAVEEGEDAYMSDGMWITPDGRLVEK